MQSTADIEWWKNSAAIEAVTIGFSLRQPAGMEIVPNFFTGDDADCGRQQSVQGALKFRCRQVGSGLKMGSLSERMNASVRAVPFVHHGVFLSDFARGVVDGSLDRGQAGLELPAVEGGAVVRDGQSHGAHAQGHYRMRRRRSGTSGGQRDVPFDPAAYELRWGRNPGYGRARR